MSLKSFIFYIPGASSQSGVWDIHVAAGSGRPVRPNTQSREQEELCRTHQTGICRLYISTVSVTP